MAINYIEQLGFDEIEDLGDVDYVGEGIAFHTDIRELPMKDGSIRMNMFSILACIRGKMQIEMNTEKYTVTQNQVLVCRPNDMIDNCMLSPDFEGTVLCLSRRGIMELVNENELWDRAIKLGKNPIIRIREGGLEMMRLFGELMRTKIRMEKSVFYKEIIFSIVKAGLYELMSNVDTENISESKAMIKQREVLFRKFISLLSECRVKPRTITWYADKLCVTAKYLSTVSKQVSGKTAFEWINEYVQRDIRNWLRNSDKSIKEIYQLLNFPSISFFGKYCRTHLGASPTELRKQLREQGD
jgi:AraC-like DNA-binding protein